MNNSFIPPSSGVISSRRRFPNGSFHPVKIVICTTPIRPTPTDYPPLGSLAVIQSLRDAGYDPIFFDIDALRPSFEEVVDRFRIERPDVIGISAVVSTAYGYVKKLCAAIRLVLPEVKIVLGGNLAASAEILHRFGNVDVCVIGEGERITVNLLNYYAKRRYPDDYSELQRIRGITFLNSDDELVFTGYEDPIPAHELFDPDFSILEQYSNIQNFITDPLRRHDFVQDARSYEPHRAGKRLATVVSAKGCVGRCTFCHRWDKGFRQIPPERVIRRIKYLKDRYDVGFICFGDENFGSDRRATDELIRLIKPLDILWQVGGIRARGIDLGLLKRMREAGCVALYYGFETGSPDILDIMEKKLDLSDNYNAARCTYEAGLYTVYQLVLGMPGETHRTIRETIEMIKRVTEFLPRPPSEYISVNFIQALPGTPVYEYVRAKGLVGPTLEDEEQYLLKVSDIDAADDTTFLNFTQYPYLVIRTWRPLLTYEATVHWYRKRKSTASRLQETPVSRNLYDYKKGGYFNRYNLGYRPTLLKFFYPIRWLPIWLWTLWSEYRRCPTDRNLFARRLWELLTWPFLKRTSVTDCRSLRHIMRDIAPKPISQTEKSMMPLRLGR